MKLNLIFLGKTKEAYLALGIEDYLSRLKRYVDVSITVLKEKKKLKDNGRLQIVEGEQLLKSVGDKAYIVALAPAGEMVSSEKLAYRISQWENQGRQNITFLIGGPTGLSTQVLGKANWIFSLSQLTFTHEIARFILLEQLYRAFSIKAGAQYHK